MNYFDYIAFNKIEDTKNNFIKYLVDILDYTKEEAEKEAVVYFM